MTTYNDEPPLRPSVRRGSGCSVAGAVAAVVLIALGALLAYLAILGRDLYQKGSDVVEKAERRVSAPLRLSNTPTPALATTSVLARKLEDASELTTAVYTLETVVTESLDRKLGELTIGTTELLYVAHGVVRAGIDLSEIDDSNFEVDMEGRTLTVTLPPPRILDRKIDVDKSYVYDARKSLLGPADPAMQSNAERFALEQIVYSACEGGVMEQANTRALMAVGKLLEDAAGYEEVVVLTQEPEAGECPSGPPPTSTPGTVQEMPEGSRSDSVEIHPLALHHNPLNGLIRC
jgi:hypothetical protein